MARITSRRNFLRTAPVVAAAGFTLTNTLMATAQAGAQAGAAGDYAAFVAQPFKLFSGKELDADAKALREKPGNNNLVAQAAGFPCAVVMTTETHASAKEFEWHEGHDHIVQIIEGSTLYEVGGTPKNGRNTKAGEWLAPASDGSKSLLLGKGDMLVIPRGTPHKRSTEDSVTFYLISSYGVMKA